jgi:hypothetical protein
MDRNKGNEELDDTQIRRDTQVRGSLGQPPSGLSDDEWSEEVGERDEAQSEQVRGRSTDNRDRSSSDSADDDRMSER